MPIPDGGDVQSSLVAGASVVVTIFYPNDRFDDIAGFYDSWTDGNGETWQMSESTFSQGDQTMRSRIWQAEDTVTAITVIDCYGLGDTFDGPFTTTCVSITETN